MNKVDNKLKRSLIVVPSSLTEHWHHEIKQFCDKDIVKPILYQHLQAKGMIDSDEYNVLIISYF